MAHLPLREIQADRTVLKVRGMPVHSISVPIDRSFMKLLFIVLNNGVVAVPSTLLVSLPSFRVISTPWFAVPLADEVRKVSLSLTSISWSCCNKDERYLRATLVRISESYLILFAHTVDLDSRVEKGLYVSDNRLTVNFLRFYCI